MNDILSIGSAGLSAYRKTLETISSNIVNANTEGYVRRQVVLKGTGESNMLATAKPNSSGSGVEVESIGRATYSFLQKQMLTATAVNSQAQIVSDSLAQLEKTAFSSSNDLSASVETFYNSMQDVANAPTALANRYGLINSGQKIADRFNATAKAIDNGIAYATIIEIYFFTFFYFIAYILYCYLCVNIVLLGCVLIVLFYSRSHFFSFCFRIILSSGLSIFSIAHLLHESRSLVHDSVMDCSLLKFK